MRLNPGALIPLVHDFTAEKTFTSELINQTRDILQDFLDVVLRHPLHGCNELVYYFLHYPNKDKKADEFTRRAKLYAALPIPMHVEDMKTVNGEAKLSVTKEREKYVEMIAASALSLKASYQEY